MKSSSHGPQPKIKKSTIAGWMRFSGSTEHGRPAYRMGTRVHMTTVPQMLLNFPGALEPE